MPTTSRGNTLRYFVSVEVLSESEGLKLKQQLHKEYPNLARDSIAIEVIKYDSTGIEVDSWEVQ